MYAFFKDVKYDDFSHSKLRFLLDVEYLGKHHFMFLKNCQLICTCGEGRSSNNVCFVRAQKWQRFETIPKGVTKSRK